jgi:hypothetical protein
MKTPETIAGKPKNHKIVVALLFLSFLLALAGYFQHHESQKVLTNRVVERIAVSVALVSKAAVRDSFGTVGTVEALQGG